MGYESEGREYSCHQSEVLLHPIRPFPTRATPGVDWRKKLGSLTLTSSAIAAISLLPFTPTLDCVRVHTTR